MNTQNRISQILGIKYPIVQGAMSWVTNAKLVSAVSNSGGLGILGPHAGQTDNPNSTQEIIDRMRREIRKTKELTDLPFGVPIILTFDLSSIMQMVDLIIEEGVSVALVNGVAGVEYSEIFAKFKGAGVKILYRPSTSTVEEARQAERMGADVYIATGFDEGGTVPERVIGSFSAISHIVDSVNIPVMLAGGVADVRGVRAAFALGAEGVYIGTAFLATVECPMAENAKQMLVENTADDLLLYRVSPAYYRSLPTAFARELLAMDEQGKSREEIGQRMYSAGAMKRAMLDGDLDGGIVSVGNGITYIHQIRPTAELVADLMQDFR